MSSISVKNIQPKFLRMSEKFKEKIANRFWTRMPFEFFSAFVLIFIINLGLSLGQANPNIAVFNGIFNINVLTAAWISFFTLVAFGLFYYFGISVNVVTAVLAKRNGTITNWLEFVVTICFQLVGSILASLVIYKIVLAINNGAAFENSLGGTTTTVKGLFLYNGDFSWGNISFYEIWRRYLFAMVQGLINGISIIILFLGNLVIDYKSNTSMSMFFYRFCAMTFIFSITTIFSANTTNIVRLLGPAIVSEIFHTQTYSILGTTIVYGIMNSLALIYIFAEAKISKKYE